MPDGTSRGMCVHVSVPKLQLLCVSSISICCTDFDRQNYQVKRDWGFATREGSQQGGKERSKKQQQKTTSQLQKTERGKTFF